MRDALKSFYFRKKSVNAREAIFFSFYQIVMETLLFMKEFKWKIFTNRNYADFAMKTLYLALKLVFKKKQSIWSTTCFTITLPPLEGKTLLYPDVPQHHQLKACSRNIYGWSHSRSSPRTFTDYVLDSIFCWFMWL